MCQLIVKPKGVVIYRKTLETAWNSNPHGGGFGYINPEDNEVWMKKGYTKFDAFWESFQEYMQQDCLLHFRWATHGDRSEGNMHPFGIAPNVCMGHNGVMHDFIPGSGDNRSDTRIFAGRLKTWVDKAGGWDKFMTQGTIDMLGEMIGHNKLAFLTNKGFLIINEELGEWADGSWYSAGVPKHYEPHFQSKGHWESMADSMADDMEGAYCYPRNEVVKDQRTAAILQSHLDSVSESEKKGKRDIARVTEEERQKLIDQNYVTWLGKDGLRHRRHYAFMTQTEWEEMEEDQLSRKGGPALVEDPTTGDVVLLEEEDIPLANENEGDIAMELIQFMTLTERDEFRELIKDPSINHEVRDRILKRLKRGNGRIHRSLMDPTFARESIRLLPTNTATVRVLDNRAGGDSVVDSVEAAVLQHDSNQVELIREEVIDVTASPVNEVNDRGDE